MNTCDEEVGSGTLLLSSVTCRRRSIESRLFSPTDDDDDGGGGKDDDNEVEGDEDYVDDDCDCDEDYEAVIMKMMVFKMLMMEVKFL